MKIKLLDPTAYFESKNPSWPYRARESLGKGFPDRADPHRMTEEEFKIIFGDLLIERQNYSRTFMFIFFHFVFEDINNWSFNDGTITNLPKERVFDVVSHEQTWNNLSRHQPEVLKDRRYFIFTKEDGSQHKISGMVKPFEMKFQDHEKVPFGNFLLYAGPEMLFPKSKEDEKSEDSDSTSYKKTGETVI